MDFCEIKPIMDLKLLHALIETQLIMDQKNRYTKEDIIVAPTNTSSQQVKTNWATPGTLPPSESLPKRLLFHASMSDQEIKEECKKRNQWIENKVKLPNWSDILDVKNLNPHTLKPVYSPHES